MKEHRHAAGFEGEGGVAREREVAQDDVERAVPIEIAERDIPATSRERRQANEGAVPRVDEGRRVALVEVRRDEVDIAVAVEVAGGDREWPPRRRDRQATLDVLRSQTEADLQALLGEQAATRYLEREYRLRTLNALTTPSLPARLHDTDPRSET